MHVTSTTLISIRLHKKQTTGYEVSSFVQTKISFDLGKNEGHALSGLGGGLIVVERQVGRQ